MTSRRISPFLFLILCALFCRVAQAQKLYLLTAGDVRDQNLGKSIRQSYTAFSDVIRRNLSGRSLVEYNKPGRSGSFWRGPDLAASQNLHDDILSAIERCPAGRNDTICFYWVGHGAYDNKAGELKHYLKLPESQSDPILYRSDILDALTKKQARLTVLITDSCNEYQRVPVKVDPSQLGPTVAPAFEPGMREPTKENPLPLLFFRSRGIVDVNSASPDQRAVVVEGGGIFSLILAEVLRPNYVVPQSWSDVFDRVDFQLESSLRYLLVDSKKLGDDSEDADLQQEVYRISLPGQGNNEQSFGGSADLSGGVPRENLSLAGTLGGENTRYYDDSGPDWSERSNWYPENGDRIIGVNGVAVRNEPEYRQAVKDSPETITLTLIGRRGGLYALRTHLWPRRGNYTRLGIYIETAPEGGVTVTGLVPNSPAYNCRYKWLDRDFEDTGYDDDSDYGWSEHSNWHPETGDLIIEVNGVPVRNEPEYCRAVKNSPETITLTLIDRHGSYCYLRTHLWPRRGNNTRLGIYIETAPGGGVVVTGLVPNSPAYHCRHKVAD